MIGRFLKEYVKSCVASGINGNKNVFLPLVRPERPSGNHVEASSSGL